MKRTKTSNVSISSRYVVICHRSSRSLMELLDDDTPRTRLGQGPGAGVVRRVR
jgi:hypothetical protein